MNSTPKTDAVRHKFEGKIHSRIVTDEYRTNYDKIKWKERKENDRDQN